MDIKNCKICITGIGGFIGNRLAEILRLKGAIVSGLELNPISAKKLIQKGFKVIVGSTSDLEILDKFLTGNDIIIHTAAIVREGGSLDEFREVNVNSSLLLAKAARDRGLRGMVHLSSVMVYGFEYEENINEGGELKGEGNPYCITKIEGEALLKEMNSPSFGIIIIRPGDVYGPFSNPWVLRPLELMKMGLFSLPDGGNGTMNSTYVDNLCEGIILSLSGEAFGEIFNITDGETISWADYFDGLAIAGGLSKPPRLPLFMAIFLLEIVSFFIKLTGKPSPVSRDGINFILRKNAVSIEKAKKVLGFKPSTSLREGLDHTFNWVKDNYRNTK